MTGQFKFTIDRNGDETHFFLDGNWTLERGGDLERDSEALVSAAKGAHAAVFDMAHVERMDTAGAWLIDRARKTLAAAGIVNRLENVRPEQSILFEEAGWRAFDRPVRHSPSPFYTMLVDTGEGLVAAGRNLMEGITFLGECVVATLRAAWRPRSFRLVALVSQIENIGLRSVPIIVLINFLVGSVVTQQALFQLRNFGAQPYAVDLVGVVSLRELCVMLTAIMVAGRSGSSITAELGSMKMREEIDALTVLGLSPIDVLVGPRMVALIVSMPLLTFLADMASLFGGLMVSWIYAGITPDAFLARLHAGVGVNTFMVGIIKAPFMAAIIGLISSMEGLSVKGSAESLGRHVTDSVVKSIFMVIVTDGIFTLFFAAIGY